MLAELSIKNFAIIDDLSVRFEDGLTAITGETGAGKSILINAVNLLLGARATPKMVRTGEDEAELQALFFVDGESDAARRMCDQGLNPEEGLAVRRIISTANRHKVYINGRISTMAALSEVTGSLASISGQHAHQGLLKEDVHLLVLDQYAGLMPLRDKVGGLFRRTVEATADLKKLRNLQARDARERELLHFQKEEINKAAVQPGEDADLEAEKTRLKNAEMLYQAVGGAVEELYGAQGAVIERLGGVAKELTKAREVDSALEPVCASLDEKRFGLEDAVSDMRAYLNTVQSDDRRLEEVEDRLDLLSTLKRKYGGSLEAVLEYGQDIDNRLERLENMTRDMEKAQSALKTASTVLGDTAQKLSAKRSAASERFSKSVAGELGSLGMDKTVFAVEITPLPPSGNGDGPLNVDGHGVEAHGMDRAAFLIAPNVGEEPRPLKDIASGGELSRVVLALKAILAKTDAVRTVIFDEVDAGIGGAVADSVGEKLLALSQSHQVICITHLPQIARFAARHLSITKEVSGGRTQSRVTPLDDLGRVDEIARMLAGENVTETSRQHAMELIENTKN